MSSLEKFNSTLDSFDTEVRNLKSVSESYKKLDGLVKSFDKINDSVAKNIIHFQSLLEAQKSHHKSVSDSIVEIQSEHKIQKTDLEKLLNEKMDTLSVENKKFLKDLHDTLRLQLDNNKIEIKQLIEAERARIKEIVEDESTKMKDNIASFRKLATIIGGLIILLNVVMLILRFVKI
jgi:CHASE3 domain sensor protein